MVQIIDEEPGFAQRFAQGVNRATTGENNLVKQFSDLMMQRQQKEQQQQMMHQENEALKKLGIDLTGISDPKQRQQLAVEKLRGMNSESLEKFKNQQSQSKNTEEQELNDSNYVTVKDTFGEKFANVWKAAPVGGRTKLLEQALDSTKRGLPIDELLTQTAPASKVRENEGNQDIDKKPAQLKNGKVPKDFDWPDYSKRQLGYTPKEWNELKASWRKENDPIYKENKTKLKNNKNDALSIKSLKKINKSGNLPDGLERYLINPETGELYGLAQISGMANADTQAWLKETARFQNRAKDAFGSRVTNFDLMSYMKQFPTLLNTPEGRERILGMMDINNQLDQNYENALDATYLKYGLNGISQEDAENIAQSMIQDETERLHDEYFNLDKQNEETENLSGQMVDVIGPDGQVYEVDESEVEKLPEGYRLK